MVAERFVKNVIFCCKVKEYIENDNAGMSNDKQCKKNIVAESLKVLKKE